MKEQDFNAEESISLITRMIDRSRFNCRLADFNSWIGWGVFTLLLGVVIYSVVRITGVAQWYWLWFLEFAYAIYDGKRNEAVRAEVQVVGHVNRALDSVWKALGWLFIITPVAMTFMAIYMQCYAALNMIMPLALLYTIAGVSFTGVLLGCRWAVIVPVVCSLSPMYMLGEMSVGRFEHEHVLLFAATFFLVMTLSWLALKKLANEIQGT